MNLLNTSRTSFSFFTGFEYSENMSNVGNRNEYSDDEGETDNLQPEGTCLVLYRPSVWFANLQRVPLGL